MNEVDINILRDSGVGQDDLLAELQAIKQNTSETTINAGDIELHVDGLEALQALTNDKLDHLSSDLDSILSKNTDLEVLLTNIDADTNDIKTSVQLLDNAVAGNELQCDIVSSALPSGASTEAKQDDGITHLATIAGDTTSIDGKITAIETLVTQLDVVADACLVKHTNNETLLTQLDVVADASLAKLTEFAEVVEEILDDLTVSVGNGFSAEYHKGIGMYAVRQDTQANFGDDGDYVPLGIDSNGDLRVKLDDASKSVLDDAEVHLGSIDGKITACNTGAVTVSSSALPSGAATSALQAGGLPSALSSDNLKVSLKETIDLPITNGPLTNLDAAINSNRVDVNIAAGNISGFATSALQAGGLPSALSSDNLKVSLKETIDLPITNGPLTNLDAAINSNRVDVNIAAGNISGFATATLQGAGLPSALSSDNLKVSLKETIDLPITNGPLTNLDAAINSARVDVNIAAGNISGFATSALQAGGLPSALSSDNLKVSLKETIDCWCY
jgi:hypothetical protein